MSELNQTNMAIGEWQHGVTGTPFDERAGVQEMDALPVPMEQWDTLSAGSVEVMDEITEEEIAGAETAMEETAVPEDTVGAIQPEEQPQEDDEETKRAKHEVAEAERKAEWEARQQAKKDALKKQQEELASMSDDEIVQKSMKRISADTEKLTRRNMKECVAEYIQTMCMEDIEFARMTMNPKKSMIHCFQYINRKAWDYVQDEMKVNDIKPGIGQQGYGCDIPDGLCYQWAEDYFRDPSAEEDEQEEEKFVSKPYVGKTGYKPAAKKKTEKKEKKPKASEKKPEQGKKTDEAEVTQLSLLDMIPQEDKAS